MTETLNQRTMREASERYARAAEAQLSQRGVEALSLIGVVADDFRADRIDALRFVVRVGIILADLEAGRLPLAAGHDVP